MSVECEVRIVVMSVNSGRRGEEEAHRRGRGRGEEAHRRGGRRGEEAYRRVWG